MKKIVSLVAAFAFIFVSAGAAQAAITVNDDSKLDYFRRHFSTITSTNSNSATIYNSVSSTSNSGGNTISAKEDVEDGHIMSGDAEATVEVESVANEIDSDVDASFDATGDNCACVGNITVDDDSDANFDERTGDDTTVRNNNEVVVANEVETRAHSGNNTVESRNDDVEGGSIESGSTTTMSSVANAFNILKSRITRN